LLVCFHPRGLMFFLVALLFVDTLFLFCFVVVVVPLFLPQKPPCPKKRCSFSLLKPPKKPKFFVPPPPEAVLIFVFFALFFRKCPHFFSFLFVPTHPQGARPFFPPMLFPPGVLPGQPTNTKTSFPFGLGDVFPFFSAVFPPVIVPASFVNKVGVFLLLAGLAFLFKKKIEGPPPFFRFL